MKHLLHTCLILVAANLGIGHAASAEPIKLLFSSPQDITNTWGKLHFGVTPVRLIREAKHPGFNVVGGSPCADGTWEVFGQQMREKIGRAHV